MTVMFLEMRQIIPKIRSYGFNPETLPDEHACALLSKLMGCLVIGTNGIANIAIDEKDIPRLSEEAQTIMRKSLR